MLDVLQYMALRVDEELESVLFHKEGNVMSYYTVRTTPSMRRGSGIVGYWVVLREYTKAKNRYGVTFKKFLGFIHISNDLFPSRIEALRFGREEIKKRKERISHL